MSVLLKFTTLDEAVRHMIKRKAYGFNEPYVMEARIPYLDLELEPLGLCIADWRAARSSSRPMIKSKYSLFQTPTWVAMPYGILTLYACHIAASHWPMRIYIDEIKEVWPNLQKACGVPEVMIKGKWREPFRGRTHFTQLKRED